MTFCLNSIIIKPEEGTEIKNAIILLHGYGGDGKDISMLTLNWKRHLPNTIFICPNGHEKCAINPSGYQWFDLTKEDPSYILEESIKAENVIKKFIEEVKTEYNLSNQQICLSGFSQGCMMSLNVGLTSKEKFLCIVGFSGKIIDQIYITDFTNQSLLIFKGNSSNLKANTLINFLKNNDFEKKYQIESLEFINKRRWDINLYTDVKLMLSEKDPNQSIQNFIMIQNKLSETDINNIKTYDLRNLKKTILINLND